MTLQQSWLVAEKENELKSLRRTVARLEAERSEMRVALRGMLAELVQVGEDYDTYDNAERVAHWRGVLARMGVDA